MVCEISFAALLCTYAKDAHTYVCLCCMCGKSVNVVFTIEHLYVVLTGLASVLSVDRCV